MPDRGGMTLITRVMTLLPPRLSAAVKVALNVPVAVYRWLVVRPVVVGVVSPKFQVLDAMVLAAPEALGVFAPANETVLPTSMVVS